MPASSEGSAKESGEARADSMMDFVCANGSGFALTRFFEGPAVPVDLRFFEVDAALGGENELSLSEAESEPGIVVVVVIVRLRTNSGQ